MKINNYPNIGTLSENDIILLETTSGTKKMKVSDLKSLFFPIKYIDEECDLDSLTEPGMYSIKRAKDSPCPVRDELSLIVIPVKHGNEMKYTQIAVPGETASELYIRSFYGIIWGSWYLYTNTSNIFMENNAYIRLYGKDAINGGISIQAGKDYQTTIYPGEMTVGQDIVPYKANNGSIGRSSYKFSAIYVVNGTIQTSDRNEKNTIREITVEEALTLIKHLKPMKYKMNAGTSGRTHWGIISQDVEELLNTLGWTSLDFAGFIKSPHYEIDTVDEVIKKPDGTEETIQKRVPRLVDGQYDYSLRYDEFIAPIIKVIQNQEERLSKIEEELGLR